MNREEFEVHLMLLGFKEYSTYPSKYYTKKEFKDNKKEIIVEIFEFTGEDIPHIRIIIEYTYQIMFSNYITTLDAIKKELSK